MSHSQSAMNQTMYNLSLELQLQRVKTNYY